MTLNKIIRQVLYSTLGDENYLRIVSNVYLKMFHYNMLTEKYPELYFLRKLVKKNSVCIDIGANLGYYSVPLAEICAPEGKVYAVEPVPLFRRVLERNINRYKAGKNVEIMPYALGDNDGETLTMGTPVVNGLMHHGYTKVLTKEENDIASKYEVKTYTADTLFKDLTRLDFIKCDVEGYEVHIMPKFRNIIEKFLPAIQIEIVPVENKKVLLEMFKGLGYTSYYFDGQCLRPIEEMSAVKVNDYVFIPNSKTQNYSALIQK